MPGWTPSTHPCEGHGFGGIPRRRSASMCSRVTTAPAPAGLGITQGQAVAMRWRTSSTSEPDVDLAGILVGLDARRLAGRSGRAAPDLRQRRVLGVVRSRCRRVALGAGFRGSVHRRGRSGAGGGGDRASAARSGERQELEYRLVAPDGGVVWVMNAFRAVSRRAGPPIRARRHGRPHPPEGRRAGAPPAAQPVRRRSTARCSTCTRTRSGSTTSRRCGSWP